MKETFSTSVGKVEVLVDEQSRTVSAYRFDAEGRPIAAAIESWDYTDLADLLTRQAGVPAQEAINIASQVSARVDLGDAPPLPTAQRRGDRARERRSSVEYAGVPLRFVAVLLDAVIVFFPAGIIFGLLTGGGYTQTGNGYTNAGINIEGKAFWVFLLLGLGYYVVCEGGTGATLGKRMVGIQVIGEDGEDLTLGAAVVRNLLRVVDCLFFYLVGAIFALTSAQGQRLGDRAAHTLVVRR
ncbi:MAG TPA: RDD family protein [Gaiellaceae bacterium]